MSQIGDDPVFGATQLDGGFLLYVYTGTYKVAFSPPSPSLDQWARGKKFDFLVRI